MKPKTLMLLCVAVGCGLVAMIGVQQALNKPKVADVATVNVAVALADINPGEPLTEANVGFKEIPLEGAREDSVVKPEDYAQRSLKVAVMQGDYITKAKLNEKGVVGKSSQIKSDTRIFTMNVDETQSASSMIAPGDWVDVAVTFDVRTPTGMQTKSMTLLERVEIFAVADQTKGDRTKSGDSSKVNARQISLIVAPEQVNWLLLAKRKGQLELLWRNPTDTARSMSKTATDQLLADLRGLDNYSRTSSEEPQPQPELTAAAEPKPPVPDLSSFLNQAKEAVATLPKPTPAPAAETDKSKTPAWEVKVYKGNEIQSYAFEVNDGSNKNDPARKAESKPAEPAKAASAATNLLESFGWSLPSLTGAQPVAPASSPEL
ncbi:MAG TPA: Flp pilus assembly protein CpaB [Caulifigura sp.]|jgi:pilus assembly protein CpaB|nr:Flp pilus assembly protein CpaB [Caulifigura sp.]